MLPRKSTLLLCCLTRKVNLNTKHALSLNRIRNSSAWIRLGSFVRFIMSPSNDIRFSEEVIQRMHRHDKISQTEWVLIYNDLNYARLRAFGVFFSASILFIATFIVWDKFENNSQVSKEKFKTIERHAYDFGYGMYIVYLTMPLSFMFTTRLMQLRLYRVYQNIKDPFKYKAIISRTVVFTKKMEFPRDKIEPNKWLHDDQNDAISKFRAVMHRLIYGHAKLDGHKVIIEKDVFKNNASGTFMLHDTKSPPRLV